MAETFNVMLTGDFYDAEGKPKYADLGLGVFAGHSHIAIKSFREHCKQIEPDQIARGTALLPLLALQAESLAHLRRSLPPGSGGKPHDGPLR